VGGYKFFERREVKDIMSYVRLIANPRDIASATRTINTPSRGIGEKTQYSFFAWVEETIHNKIITNATLIPTVIDFLYAVRFISSGDESSLGTTQESISLRENLVQGCTLSTRELRVLGLYSKLITEMIEISNTKSVIEFLQFILEKLDIREHLSKISKDPSEVDDRMENVNELLRSASTFRYTSNNTIDQLYEFVEHAALFDALEEDEISQTDTSKRQSSDVQLMTIHASKGLEFDTVFLSGCEQGVLPSKPRMFTNLGTTSNASTTEAIQEERRLMYVAATRAKEKLYVLWREEMMEGGKDGSYKKKIQKRSEFITPLEKLSSNECQFI
jgi:DNA helicase-2/ATP-dependent DNA helicase PcrA